MQVEARDREREMMGRVQDGKKRNLDCALEFPEKKSRSSLNSDGVDANNPVASVPGATTTKDNIVKPLSNLSSEECISLFCNLGCLNIREILAEQNLSLQGSHLVYLTDPEDIQELGVKLPKFMIKSILAHIDEYRTNGVPLQRLASWSSPGRDNSRNNALTESSCNRESVADENQLTVIKNEKEMELSSGSTTVESSSIRESVSGENHVDFSKNDKDTVLSTTDVDVVNDFGGDANDTVYDHGETTTNCAEGNGENTTEAVEGTVNEAASSNRENEATFNETKESEVTEKIEEPLLDEALISSFFKGQKLPPPLYESVSSSNHPTSSVSVSINSANQLPKVSSAYVATSSEHPAANNARAAPAVVSQVLSNSHAVGRAESQEKSSIVQPQSLKSQPAAAASASASASASPSKAATSKSPIMAAEVAVFLRNMPSRLNRRRCAKTHFPHSG